MGISTSLLWALKFWKVLPYIGFIKIRFIFYLSYILLVISTLTYEQIFWLQRNIYFLYFLRMDVN